MNKREYNREYNRRVRREKVLAVMLSRAKSRASRKGIVFDLTEEDLHLPTHCPILGLELKVGDPDAGPSLDRIIPEHGYVRGNVIIISNRANRLRSDGLAAEHAAISKFYRYFD